jgi:hypothetical protein
MIIGSANDARDMGSRRISLQRRIQLVAIQATGMPPYRYNLVPRRQAFRLVAVSSLAPGCAAGLQHDDDRRERTENKNCPLENLNNHRASLWYPEHWP